MCAQKIGVLKIMRVKEDLIVNNKGGSQVVSGISAAAINPTLEFKSQNVPGYLNQWSYHLAARKTCKYLGIFGKKIITKMCLEVRFMDVYFFFISQDDAPVDRAIHSFNIQCMLRPWIECPIECRCMQADLRIHVFFSNG